MIPPRRARLLGALAIIAVALVSLLPALPGGFHLDDQYRIVDNPELDHVWPLWRHFVDPSTSASLPTIVQFRPLLPLTLSITAAFADALGIAPEIGHRLGNLGLHIVCSLLVAALVRVLAGRGAPRVPAGELGLWAGLLYAAHPVAGVPVHYLCARDLLLMQAFLLSSLWMFAGIRIHGSTPRRWAAALGLLSLSLLSKTDAVVAPALVGAIDFAVFGASLRSARTWARAAVFTLPVLAFFGWTELVLDFSDAGQLVVSRPPLEYPLTQARLHLFYYLRNAIWPFEMRALPSVAPADGLGDLGVLLGLAVFAGSIVLAWRYRARAPLAALCVVAYWIAFAPTSWFLPFRYLATDYRQVPALPWLCTLAAWALLRARPPSEARAALAVLTAYFVGASILLASVWRDEVTLWGHAVRRGAEVQAHVNFGRALAGTDPERARAHYNTAVTRAPDNVFALINLGMLDVHEGRFTDGITHLDQAVARAPQWPMTHQWRHRGCTAVLGRAPPTNPGARRCQTLLAASPPRPPA